MKLTADEQLERLLEIPFTQPGSNLDATNYSSVTTIGDSAGQGSVCQLSRHRLLQLDIRSASKCSSLRISSDREPPLQGTLRRQLAQ